MRQSGHADLPLHYGKVPPWLANRMAKLGRAILESIVLEYGKSEVIQRLSDPMWFQSLGCVLGMDWHSSGITTSVMGALKKSINPISKDLGIYICGGRGKHSRKTPQELIQVGERTGFDGNHLARCSRLSAKVDSTAIQDGFQIYLHNFVVTDEGEWAVIQQGLNDKTGYARRYHWHSKDLDSFIDDPHSFIYGKNQGLILNLTDTTADHTRNAVLDISTTHPDRVQNEIKKLILPAHHDVRLENVDMKRLGSVVAFAYENDIQDFENLLLTKGLGPRTLQSLTLVSEVIYGTPSRFKDPARFSFAHGGKDGHPFPVPTFVYDKVIDTFDRSIQRAKLGITDKKEALKSLHKMAKSIEQDFQPNENLNELIAKEWEETSEHGGRTVFADYRPGERTIRGNRRAKPSQLKLF